MITQNKLKQNLGRLLSSSFIIAALLLSPLGFAASYNAVTATDYLLNHSGNPWSTMALASVNAAAIPSEYLKTVSGSSAINFEAPILAITSINQDPKTFGATDYIAKLKSFHSAGQIGDTSTLNDDIFGILALVSVGEPLGDPVISDSKKFLLNHQNSDGGWAFAVGGTSDSNTTASALVALASVGLAATNTQIQNALNYLKTAQKTDGGLTYDPTSSFGTDSDSSSTAWLLWALNALKIDQATWSKGNNTPKSYLEGNQKPGGYFEFQPSSGEDAFSQATTAYALIALNGKTLPVHILSASNNPQSFNFRIEGSQDTICSGKAAGPSALDVVKNAAAQCNYTYNIQSLSFGPYLNQINNDTASGQTGWLYLVNNISPNVGASDYQLKQGDEVLWYFGDFGWLPTRINLAETKINSSQSTQATVESLNNGSWSPLSAASISVGTQNFTSDNSGHAAITSQDGYYKIFASKTGYIRSNSVLLQIGQPSTDSLSLTANIKVGQIQGTSTDPGLISFTVDQQSLDFGTLEPRGSNSKKIKISNNGSNKLRIESIVSGDSIFVENLTINNTAWQKFKASLNAGLSEEEDVKLVVPQNYSGNSGQKNGQLIFWATAE